MVEETRKEFHRELDQIDMAVVHLFALVVDAVESATTVFLTGDRAGARRLVEQDPLIDVVYRDVEELAQRQFALQAPVAADMRFLLSVLRVVPELERSGDLTEHIARRGARGVAEALPPRAIEMVEGMGRVATEMWREASDGWIHRRGDVGTMLNARDDELDDLHVSLTAEILSADLPAPIVFEMALVGRFLERLGDHAVNIGNRIRYLVHGVS